MATTASVAAQKAPINPAKIFNSTARMFFKEIGKIFPNDPTMKFLETELKSFGADKKTVFVPAMKFYKTMGTPTGIKNDSGVEHVVGDCILSRDPRLFSEECTASIPELDSIGFKVKWQKLTPTNREFVWDYLTRMADLCAKATLSTAVSENDVSAMYEAIKNVAMHTPQNTSDAERISTVMNDKGVNDIAKGIAQRIDDLCPSSSSSTKK